MALSPDTVLLFYRPYERDSYVRGDRYLKRVLRPIYNRWAGRQRVTGFDMWCQLLVRALKESGCDVRLNDFRAARRNPEHPVGLVGGPFLLDGWSLPNPAVLGPAMFDNPSQSPMLMEDRRFRYYLVTCDWMRDIFAPVFGTERVVQWHAGISTTDWPDMSEQQKDIDVLIYDKIRWDRETLVPEFLKPIEAHLAAQGLKTASIRYGNYDHAMFASQLGRSRSMLFLCEHETQGMAYQEAMAANVPVMAWDPGWWRDPARERLGVDPIRTTSVPYFSPRCGERFGNLAEFYPAFERFWQQLAGYRPREYVLENLTFAGSAQAYLQCYRDIMPGSGTFESLTPDRTPAA